MNPNQQDVSPGAARAPRTAPDVGALFDAHFDYVWNTLRRLGVREADVEDLVHDVFLKVHVRIDDYDAERPIKPWLFGFAYRVAADHRRLARHRVEVMGITAEAVDVVRAVDDRLADHRERALLDAALDTLDLDRRALLMMHDLEEVPVPQIAEALGIPLNTAYSRLRLAREALTAAVSKIQGARVQPAERAGTAPPRSLKEPHALHVADAARDGSAKP